MINPQEVMYLFFNFQTCFGSFYNVSSVKRTDEARKPARDSGNWYDTLHFISVCDHPIAGN